MAAHTVPQTLERIFSKYQSQIAFVDKQSFYRQTWTFAQVESRVDAMISYLSELQLETGDAAAICAPNSPWWVTVYLACASLGIVVVPLDFNSSAEFIDTVLAQTKTKVLFKSVYKVYTGQTKTILLEDVLHLLPAGGSSKPKLPKVTPENILEIVFTSGSTGNPKGVVLTHGNVMSNVTNFLAAWPKQKHQISLSLVPMSHMLEQTAGFWAQFSLGYTIVYIASLRPTEIAATLKDEHITSIITVPAFLQLLRRRILNQVSSMRGGGLADFLIYVSARAPRPLARWLSTPIRRKLGSELQTLAVGGAALPADVEDFWDNLGYYVIQGYGLTETSPLATYSSRLHHQPRSVGKSLPHQEFKLAETGEILLRGPHLFQGYFKDEVATRAIVDADGWLHTGDIAEIDDQGFIFLKGRLKNMLLGSNGLNIYPEDIEAKLLNFSELRDVVVLMDGRGDEPKLTAVVLTTADENYVKKAIQQVNQSLASHQMVQSHIIWPDSDFPRTPTRKVRRQVVQAAVDAQQTDAPFIPSHDTNVVYGVLRQVSGTTAPITDELILVTDLGIDSIKRLELVTLIEEKLLVAVDETVITTTTTVGQLTAAIDTARSSNASSTLKQPKGITTNKLSLFAQSVVQAIFLAAVGRYQRLQVNSWKAAAEPVLYVANHTSHLDAPTFLRVAGFKGRQTLVVAAAADYFFTSRWKAGLSRNMMHAVPVEREGSVRRSLASIGRELSAGRSVVIFPEGSRSQDGRIHGFKPGIGLLAGALQVPVVPVRIAGNFAVLPKGASWPKRGQVSVHVGAPRSYSVSQSPTEIAADLQNAVEAL